MLINWNAEHKLNNTVIVGSHERQMDPPPPRSLFNPWCIVLWFPAFFLPTKVPFARTWHKGTCFCLEKFSGNFYDFTPLTGFKVLIITDKKKIYPRIVMGFIHCEHNWIQLNYCIIIRKPPSLQYPFMIWDLTCHCVKYKTSPYLWHWVGIYWRLVLQMVFSSTTWKLHSPQDKSHRELHKSRQKGFI